MAMLNKTFPVSVYNWTPERGFKEKVPSDAIPLRPLGKKNEKFAVKESSYLLKIGAGAHLGLTVVLDAQTDNYYCSSTSSIGFKVNRKLN